MLVFFAACGPGQICGPGTHDADGVCVPDAAPRDSGSEVNDSDDGGEGAFDGTYEVCADGSAEFSSLQAAVDAASEGAVLDLCPGAYDWVTIERTGVTLKGYGEASIEGKTHTAVSVDSQAVVLDGITLTGHAGTGLYLLGLDCQYANLTLRDVRFEGMSGESAYNGLVANTCDVVVDGLVVVDNSDFGGLTFYGGGSLDMRHVVIANNSGFRFIATDSVDAEIRNAIVANNDFDDSLVYLYIGPVRMWNVVIWGNTEVGNGGWALSMNPEIEVYNSVIARTQGSNGYGLSNANAASFDYNVVWLNEGADGTYETQNNLDLDPKFVDPDNFDFTLEPGLSPCVDAGNPLSGYNDLDGTRADIGAFGGPDGDWTPTL